MTSSRREFGKTVLALTTAVSFAGLFCCQKLNPIRFGIVTDPHFADRESAGSRHYRDSGQKMEQAIDLFNTEKVDFVIELGDFKDQDSPPDEQKTISHLQSIENIFQKFNGPVYHVLGNHDMDSISKKQFLQNVKNTGIPQEQSYFSFDHNGFHFVVLDANYSSDGTPYNHGNFDWTDANIPREELEWLQQDLGENRKPAIAYIHQLLDGEGPHFVNNANEVRQILSNSGNVLAVFQGHKHDGQYNKIDGIHYITCEAMVEEPFPKNRYYIATVDTNLEIKITTFANAKNIELT